MTSVNSVQIERTLTQADFDTFAALSGDNNPIHVDAAFCAATRFGKPVSHGALLCSIVRGIVDRLVPGAQQRSQSVTFPSPAFAGEPLRFEASVTDRRGNLVAVKFRVIRVADGALTCEGSTSLVCHAEEK